MRYQIKDDHEYYYDFMLENFLREVIEDDVDTIIDHANELKELSLWINDTLKLGVDRKEIVYAAMLHDVFSEFDKKNHHSLAYDFIENHHSEHDVFKPLNYESRKRVSMTALEHRSCLSIMSYHSTLSALISAADMGVPNLNIIVGKAFKYAISKKHNDEILNARIIAKQVMLYLRSKYSDVGSAKYNSIYKQAFSDKIEKLVIDINKLSISEITNIGYVYLRDNNDDNNLEVKNFIKTYGESI